jgi:hypothetical protein
MRLATTTITWSMANTSDTVSDDSYRVFLVLVNSVDTAVVGFSCRV